MLNGVSWTKWAKRVCSLEKGLGYIKDKTDTGA